MLFRDLNYSWGCSPLPTQAYPVPASPDFYGVRTFGVGQGPEPFRALKPQSVSLPHELPQSRLDYGQLWLEPAITVLDWLFTPTPRSEEHLYVAPLRPSTQFYSRFSLPRGRSNRFGSYPCDYRHFHTSLLITCELVAFAPPAPLRVRLATKIHSLARYSKRTVHNQSFSCAPHYQ